MTPFWSRKPATSKVQTLPPSPATAASLPLRSSPTRCGLRHLVNSHWRPLQARNPPCHRFFQSSQLPTTALETPPCRWKPGNHLDSLVPLTSPGCKHPSDPIPQSFREKRGKGKEMEK